MSPPATPTDASVIRQSLQRPQAFAAIFDRHFDAIHGYLARRIGGDRADDLAATTFTIAFERRGTFRDREDAAPWLYGIATNLLRSEWRSERRALDVLPRLVAEARGRESGDDEAIAAASELAAALAQLHPDQRDVLLLHAWEDLRYGDIAAALQIPVGTVRSRLARARTQLRAALTPADGRPTEVTG